MSKDGGSGGEESTRLPAHPPTGADAAAWLKWLAGPRQFTWRGLPHEVEHVLIHRRVNSETWRVQAIGTPSSEPGVFDLHFNWDLGAWTISRITMKGEDA